MSISLYRFLVSPLLGVNCRYHPVCSDYAEQVIARHGFFRGVLLAAGRVLRCHPLGGSGHDPPP